MLNKIICVQPLPKYRLYVEFADGVKGTIDLTDELSGPMFEPLLNETFFRTVSIDDFGAVFWPNGADLAPDVMHGQLTKNLSFLHEDAPKASA